MILMWKICFSSLLADWEEMRCVREGKEWWSLCSMLKGWHYPDVPRQMCTERKQDIALPKSGNNEHSMLDNATNLVLFLSIKPPRSWNHWGDGKDRGRAEVGAVNGAKVVGRWNRREEGRGQVCLKCKACVSSVQEDKNFVNNGVQ